MTVEATGSSGAVVSYSGQSANDIVDGSVAVTCTPASGSTFALGANAVNCSATDSHLNTGTAGFTITVQDTKAPVLSLPANMSLQATSPSGATATFSASASDIVDGSVAVTCTPASGSMFALGANVVTCSATDAAGNAASGSFTVTVQDTTPPVIAAHVNVTAEATSAAGALVTYTSPATSDAVDGPGTATCAPASGSQFPLGDTTVTCNATDAAGNHATATTFKVSVVDTTPPVVSIDLAPTSPDGAHGWYVSTVTVTVTATDAVGVTSTEYSLDGAAYETYSGPFTISTDSTSHSVSARASDAAANEGSAGPSTFKLDLTGPTATLSANPATPDGDNGWYHSDVTITTTGSDSVSDPTSCTGSQSQTTDTTTTGHVFTGLCTNDAGLTTSASTLTVKRDATKPTISYSVSPASPDGTNGWYKSAPTVTFICGDATSGIYSCVADGESTASKTLGESTAAQSVSGTATDYAGNSNTDAVTGLKVDLSNPTNVAFSSTLSGSYYFGSVPLAPTCAANDAISGLHGCVVSGYSTAVGPHTLFATATDNAGRTATASSSYTVLAWTVSGFYSPVGMFGIVNTVKGGSTVPLKFEIFAATELTDVSAIASFKTAEVLCSGLSSLTDDIEVTTTGGTVLRYDSTSGQFIQNWQTPKLAGKCYRATMTTLDGSSLVAYFKTK